MLADGLWLSQKEEKNTLMKTLAIGQNPSGRCGVLSSELLIRKIPGAPKTTQALAIPLGRPPESDDATLLLRTPHILIAKDREIQLETSWKAPAHRLA